MKHRLEYALVTALIAVVRVMPDALVRARGTLLGLRVLHRSIGAHRRIAQRNLAAAFPARTGGASGAPSPARRSRTSAGCCSSC